MMICRRGEATGGNKVLEKALSPGHAQPLIRTATGRRETCGTTNWSPGDMPARRSSKLARPLTAVTLLPEARMALLTPDLLRTACITALVGCLGQNGARSAGTEHVLPGLLSR